MKTALAHNAPLVGYYKFTARTPQELRIVDKIVTGFKFVRIASDRVRPAGKSALTRGHLVVRPHRNSA